MTNRPTCELLGTDTPALFARAVARASELLRAGEVVALPTETVYGLAANALNPGAVERVFAIKGRPAQNPIIVHVASLEMARSCVRDWPDLAQRLAVAFWPGPLTLVLPRSSLIPDIVTAGGDTVGVRWPGHPFIQAVIAACGFPLAAPSANLSTQISPTTARHVYRQLGGKVPLVVDGGPSHVGIESTVIDLSGDEPQVLRPGMIHESAILSVIGQLARHEAVGTVARLKSPGLLPRHYSPKARLVIRNWTGDEELVRQVQELKADPRKTSVVAHDRIPSPGDFLRVSVIPHDAVAFARALYAELHACDEAGASLIVVEAVPGGPEWHAISDRLKRAAA
jgi:L-threonylcarbamoyladenylate synthase